MFNFNKKKESEAGGKAAFSQPETIENMQKTEEDYENAVNEEKVVKFNKPYNFEGKIYTELDLSGIDDLTAKDLLYIDRRYQKLKIVDMVKELSTPYALIVAEKVTGLPVEFFENLPIAAATAVKAVVSASFLDN